MERARNLKRAGGLAFLAVALLGSASLGKAQDAYVGKFTLPFAAHWGLATLPAGNYTLRMKSQAAPYLVTVRGEGQNVIIMGRTADSEKTSDMSGLTVVEVGGEHVIRSLDAGQIGTRFGFTVPKAAAPASGTEARVERISITNGTAGGK